MFLPLLVFSPRTWSLRRKNNPVGSAKLALHADFWFATVSSLTRGHLHLENNNGKTAVEAASLT